MRALLLSGLLLLVAAVESRGQEDWKLVWQDDFNGPELDFAKWEMEVNAFGGGNNELQIYTDRKENVRLENGHLVLEARRDNHGIAGTVREYSSGRIRSKRRGDWKYAKVEVRAKLAPGQGLWSAIWMMPTDDAYGGWASSGEIDIMEFKGQELNQIWGTLHYGSQWPKHVSSGEIYKAPAEFSFADDFHVFGLEWEEGVMRWTIDGKVWQTQKKWNTEAAPFPAPFDQRFHLVMNLAVGGQFVGPVGGNAKFPAQMLVDYVKIYQR